MHQFNGKEVKHELEKNNPSAAINYFETTFPLLKYKQADKTF
jgi:hypothetical protein|tara:strand:+ start:331 stop:456 length:126 start_codon:yes stop_codon:yes gene_type:complete